MRFLRACYWPIKSNLRFFIFMYLLGGLCLMSNGFGRHVAVFELFLDVYVACIFLSLFPKRIRKWVAGCLYVVFYGLALIDLGCFYQIGVHICPALLQDVLQTTEREATEALSAYLSWRVLLSPVLLILFLIVVHIFSGCVRWRFHGYQLRDEWLGLCCVVLLCICVNSSWVNKKFLYYNIVKVDNSLDEQFFHQMEYNTGLYLPVYRFLHAMEAFRIGMDEVVKLEENMKWVKVDSCTFRSPNIVLIIGESYNRNHSQLYGYEKPTTPRQMEMAKDSGMVVFSDVIAPYHQTSEVFKLVFSLYGYGDAGGWQDYPLFTQLFKKAGYQVTFVTNQFVQGPSLSIWDFYGSTFFNKESLSKGQFTHRNKYIRQYDEELIADYDSLRDARSRNNLLIFHLLGQHVKYEERYPATYRKFFPKDYHRDDLTDEDLQVLADYDNATLYNDYVVSRIVDLFRNQDAIVIYMPDHGELCFDESQTFGRSIEVNTRNEVKQQFEIPFWIWTSKKYRQSHSDICRQIAMAKDKPFMTDQLDQILLYLAGITCRDYRESDNLLSPFYNSSRRRMIMGEKDYDQVIRR